MPPRESTDRAGCAARGGLRRPEPRVPSPKQSGRAARVRSAGCAQSRHADRLSAGAVRAASRRRRDAATVRGFDGKAGSRIHARRGGEWISCPRLGRVGGSAGAPVCPREAARRGGGNRVSAAGRVSAGRHNANWGCNAPSSTGGCARPRPRADADAATGARATEAQAAGPTARRAAQTGYDARRHHQSAPRYGTARHDQGSPGHECHNTLSRTTTSSRRSAGLR
jgi:hypothetical protein